MELWGQHGTWKSVKSQSNYMKRDPEAILSVSRATMTPVPEANFGAPMPAVAVPSATIQSGVLARASTPLFLLPVVPRRAQDSWRACLQAPSLGSPPHKAERRTLSHNSAFSVRLRHFFASPGHVCALAYLPIMRLEQKSMGAC
jgi:hypothetical protein